MSPLQHRVQQVARRARRLVRLYGAGWFVALVCLAAVIVGWTDYLVRFEDAGVRAICSLVLGLVVLWGAYRFLLRTWRYRCSELRAARRIEAIHPELKDRLTSAVEFSCPPAEERGIGSLELRQVMVAETQQVAEPLDFNQCLDWRQPLRAVAAAVISLAMVAVLVVLDSGMVALAAKRMLTPWAENPWPRQHVLQWVDAPTCLAAGQDFEAKLREAAGEFPERVEIHYWFEGDDASRIQTFEMRRLGEVLVHRLSNVNRPFRYRATGGDDRAMPWRELVLVEPPRIVEREITLYPPAYTGRPARRVNANFSALAGTRVTVDARTNKPLSAAMLKTNTPGNDTTIRLTLDKDKHGFSSNESEHDWTIEQSGEYGFHLADEAGLDVGVTTRWDVRAIRDLPPTVSLREPPADRVVTPSARVSLEAIVKDDLAVRSVHLHFLRSASMDQREQTVVLWRASNSQAVSQGSEKAEVGEGTQQNIKHEWDLTEFPLMKPGEWIDFRVKARDHKSQTGESGSRRLTFISKEELEERIGQRQSKLVARIAQVLKLERKTHQRINDFDTRVRESTKLGQDEIDQLKAAELNQREVKQRLGRPAEGIAARIQALLDEAKSNGIDNPDLMTQLRRYYDTIDALNQHALVDIEHHLIDAVKLIRLMPPDENTGQRRMDTGPRDELQSLFGSIAENQRHVIETLEQLLGELEQWDSYQKLAREIGALGREQETLRGRTRKLRVETLGKSLHDLSAQQKSQLKRLTQRQNDLALQFGSLNSQMEKTQQNLLDNKPRAADRLAEARRMIQQQGVGGLIRDVGQAMKENRLGQAVDQQGSVVEQLRQLKDILANRRLYQLEHGLDVLRDAASRLKRIREKQKDIQEEIHGTDSPTEQQFRRWKQQESELGEEVKRLTRKLRRGTKTAVTELTKASEQLDAAANAAGGGELSKARGASRDARNALEDAQQKLQQELFASQNARRNARLARLHRTLRKMVARQRRIIDETRQVEQREDRNASQWRQTVQNIARSQKALSEEANELAGKWSDVTTFEFAFQQVAKCMATAGRRLENERADPETVQWQRRALDQLRQTLQAMVQDSPDKRPDPRQDEQPEAASKEGEQQVEKYILPQLKLVRTMQQQVNQETESLARVEKPWDAAQQRRHKQLVEMQKQLSVIVQRLLEKTTDAGKNQSKSANEKQPE